IHPIAIGSRDFYLETEIGEVNVGTVDWAQTTRLPETCKRCSQLSISVVRLPRSTSTVTTVLPPGRALTLRATPAPVRSTLCVGAFAVSERVNCIVRLPPPLLGQTRIRDL